MEYRHSSKKMGKYICVILFVFFANAFAADLPPYIKACPANSPDMNKCALESGKVVLKSIMKGDKQYGIPVLSPFFVELIEIKNSNLEIIIDKANIYGIENAEVLAVNINLEEKKISASVLMDRLNILGHYKANGKIATLPINGDGALNTTFIGGVYDYKTDFKVVPRGKEEYLELVNPELKFKLKKAYIDHENLFNGNEELGNQVNKFINENWELFLEDIGAAIEKTIEKIATNIIMGVAKKVPYNKIFP